MAAAEDTEEQNHTDHAEANHNNKSPTSNNACDGTAENNFKKSPSRTYGMHLW